MIIKSYLAYPIQGKQLALQRDLDAIAGCAVIPAENRELLVLVTESEDEKAEEALVTQVQNLATLQTLTLVSGHNEALAQAS